MNSQDDIYVQYGCGINAPQSWINFDASPNLRLERLPWMWDYLSLELYLKKSGFINIREAFFNDSEVPKFAEVEEKARFSKSVCIECQKK